MRPALIAQPGEIRIMRKKISAYWPLAVIVPFAAIAWIHAWQAAQQQTPLAVEQLSAELSRAVSYGYVSSDGAESIAVVRTGAALRP